MRSSSVLALICILFPYGLSAQGYTSYFTGDTTDINSNPRPGILLAGGGTDNDQAMRWLLQGADGGDVLVLRASGSDGYNEYLFSELGVNVNSVETIRFDDAAAAQDPYVLQQISRAEVLFFAGGNQRNYYDYWKGTPVETAINSLIHDKKITVGGTSAGMAVLGEHYYVPIGSGVTSDEALNNPYHPYTATVGTDSFLLAPYLDNVITDTHYDQRNRHGRHMVFMARTAIISGERTFGIACNEYVATAIQENGTALVFGGYPEYDDYAYFLQVDCQDNFQPELMQAGQALNWVRDSSAVRVYKAPARVDGSTTFDLTNWQSGNGGEWQNWFVTDGEVYEESGTTPACNPLSTSSPSSNALLELYPNPGQDQIFLRNAPIGKRKLLNVFGQNLQHWSADQNQLDIRHLPKGWYLLSVDASDGQQWIGKFFKTD